MGFVICPAVRYVDHFFFFLFYYGNWRFSAVKAYQKTVLYVYKYRFVLRSLFIHIVELFLNFTALQIEISYTFNTKS